MNVKKIITITIISIVLSTLIVLDYYVVAGIGIHRTLNIFLICLLCVVGGYALDK